jgi:ACS family tartrate transporter-like MFS transporter
MLDTALLPTDVDPIGKSAIRKASLRLLPLLALGYGAAYMDRINISFASLQMNRDLHFSAATYGLGAGLFFFSYAAFEIPSNLLLFRFGARRWMARIMISWGILAMLMFLVRTPVQFYTVRFLLGLAEAGFFPGILYYLTVWFPAGIRARAISRFYIALPLSSVLMGIIAGALLNLNGRFSLAGWQWMFLFEGLPSVLLGIVFLIYLPDSPSDARWLTPSERSWIIETIERESVKSLSKRHSALAALAEPRVWLVGTFLLLMLCSNYALLFSLPDIVRLSTHLSTTNVGFVIAGLSILGAVSMIAGAIYSDRTRQRYPQIIVTSLVAAICFFVCGVSNQPAVLLPALTLLLTAEYSMQGPVLSIPQEFFSGRSAAAGLAAVNTIAVFGGFLGPYAFGLAKNLTGNYQRGLTLMSIPTFVAAALMLYIRHIARQRDRAIAGQTNLSIQTSLSS